MKSIRDAYAAYQIIQRCYEGRRGYESVLINERELSETKKYIRAIEQWALSNDQSIDKDSEWNNADKQNRGGLGGLGTMYLDAASRGQMIEGVINMCRSNYGYLQRRYSEVLGRPIPKKDF